LSEREQKVIKSVGKNGKPVNVVIVPGKDADPGKPLKDGEEGAVLRVKPEGKSVTNGT